MASSAFDAARAVLNALMVCGCDPNMTSGIAWTARRTAAKIFTVHLPTMIIMMMNKESSGHIWLYFNPVTIC